jgi:hypothetical protein
MTSAGGIKSSLFPLLQQVAQTSELELSDFSEDKVCSVFFVPMPTPHLASLIFDHYRSEDYITDWGIETTWQNGDFISRTSVLVCMVIDALGSHSHFICPKLLR